MARIIFCLLHHLRPIWTMKIQTYFSAPAPPPPSLQPAGQFFQQQPPPPSPLTLLQQEYQKLFQENKILKEKINFIEKEKIIKKTTKNRQYKVETDSGQEEEEEGKAESEPKEIGDEGAKKQKAIVARKIKEDAKKETKLKPKNKKNKKDF